MPSDCTLSFDNLTTIPKALLTTRITTLPEAKLADLRHTLRAATRC